MSSILFLHGASSSGKSTLARAIRDQSQHPFIQLSWDTYRDSGAIDPAEYEDWSSCRRTVFDGVHRSFAAFADAGCGVIIEHILDTEGWHAQLQDLFSGHNVLFVGVFAPDHVLSDREGNRGNRPMGSAVKDARRVHTGMAYDLELDGTRDPNENAQRVLRHLASTDGRRSRFFDTIA